jgi:hypothetical protein
MSRFMWFTLLHTKGDAPAAIMMFQAHVERETGKKLKCCALIMVVSSPQLSLVNTVQEESSVTSRRHTRRSKMTLWSVGTR